MAKMRTGVAQLRIETGCYKRHALTSKQRICHICALNEPETEKNVIIMTMPMTMTMKNIDLTINQQIAMYSSKFSLL